MFRSSSHLLLVLITTYFLQEPCNKVVMGLMDHSTQEDSFILKPNEVAGIENNFGGMYSFESDYGDDSLEEECPEGQWWHIRGQRCVPIFCIGGKKFRDVVTGECLITRSWYQRGVEKGFLRYTPRTIMRSKAKTRFSLPTKVKG